MLRRNQRPSTAHALVIATLIIALSALLTLTATPQPVAAATWTPCLDTIDQMDCAKFQFPLDRSGAVGGTTHVQAIKTDASEGPRLGTLFLLAGGPGQASMPMIDFMMQLFDGANRYDLVAIDQRGSGRSEPLNCPRIETGAFTPERLDGFVGQCADALGTARAGYNTAAAVADMEAIRADLGVEQISLFGVSYGTKVALAYAHAYPHRVKSLMLDSVLPVDAPTALDIASVDAMRKSLDQICAGMRCRNVLPAPQPSLKRLVDRLSRRPVRGTLPGVAERASVDIGPDQVYSLIFAADFNLYIYQQLPAAIDAAHRNNSAPLLRLFAVLNASEMSAASGDDATRTRRARRGDPRGKLDRGRAPSRASSVAEFSGTMNLATSCEDLHAPWPRGAAFGQRQPAIDAAAASLPASDFLPFSAETVKRNSLATLCRGWPESPQQPALAAGPLPAIPTLALNGSLDVRTPAAWAKAAIAGNPAAQLVVVPNTGHSTIGTDISGCALSLAKRFLIFGGTDGKCRRRPPRVPVAPRAHTSLRSVKALSGSCRNLRGTRCRNAKRAVSVAYAAFRDAVDQYVVGGMIAGPGLYGGRWELAEEFDLLSIDEEEASLDISLKGIEQIPGLPVSGRVSLDHYPNIRARLTLTDPSGRRYRVTTSGRLAFDQRYDRVRVNGSLGRARILLRRGSRSKARFNRNGIAALRVRSAFARSAGTRRVVR